jgi:GAF domain-containing protein
LNIPVETGSICVEIGYYFIIVPEIYTRRSISGDVSIMSEKGQAVQFKFPLDFLQPDLTNLIQITAEIVAGVTTILDFDDLVETVVSLIQESLNYDQVILHIYDSDQQLLTLSVIADVNHNQIIRSSPVESVEGKVNLPQLAAQSNRTIWIRDLQTEIPDYFPTEPTDIRSELHIPLVRDEKVIGVLSLRSAKTGVFDEYRVIALNSLAAKIAIPIEQTYLQKYQSSQNYYDEGSRLPYPATILKRVIFDINCRAFRL